MFVTMNIMEYFYLHTQAPFNGENNLFTTKMDLNLRKKLMQCYIWSIAETWTIRKVVQKYLESFEMWCCRRMKMIIWTDRVINEEVLRRVKEDRNITHTIKRRKTNLIGHISRRNCLKVQGGSNMTGTICV